MLSRFAVATIEAKYGSSISFLDEPYFLWIVVNAGRDNRTPRGESDDTPTPSAAAAVGQGNEGTTAMSSSKTGPPAQA
jgi:hypothetical protein